MAFLAILFVLTLYLGFSFFISAGIIWLIAWAFDLIFSWKAAFGMWLVLMLVSGFFKGRTEVNK